MRFLYALLPLVAMVAAEPLIADEFSLSDVSDVNDFSDFNILADDNRDSNIVDVDQDYETEGAAKMKIPFRYGSHNVREGDSEYHKELPLGIEMASALKQLSRFDRSKLSADRFVRYEVNPDFDLDESRSLNLKMTPIYNFQSSRLIRRSPVQQSKIKRIMIKLAKVGIKPVTVKKYLKLRKQGFVSGVHSPVKTMLAIQQGVSIPSIRSGALESGAWGLTTGTPSSSSLWSDNIMSENVNMMNPYTNTYPYTYTGSELNQPLLSSEWSGVSTGTGVSNTLLNRDTMMMSDNVNVGIGNREFRDVMPNREFRDVMPGRLTTTTSSTLRNQDVDVSRPQGYIIPSIQLANELKDVGVTVSNTMNNQPAIEATHLQSQLLKCEVINFNSPACAKLQQFSSSILKDVSSPSALHNSILNLTNTQIPITMERNQ